MLRPAGASWQNPKNRASTESTPINSSAVTSQGRGRSVPLLLLDRRQDLLLVLQNRSLIFFDRFLIYLDLPLVPEYCFLVLQNLFLIRKYVALRHFFSSLRTEVYKIRLRRILDFSNARSEAHSPSAARMRQ